MIFNLTKKEMAISNTFRYAFFIAIMLLIIAWGYFMNGGNTNVFLALAIVFGLYMAVNIGANDVANNMGPAVGSKALTLIGAIIIAAIFEAAGAIIAGGDVVDTIKNGIIDGSSISDTKQYLSIMLATLLGASIWINIATYFRAPVSATHSIIGGLVGAGFISTYSGIYWINLYLILSLLVMTIGLSLLAGFVSKYFAEKKYNDKTLIYGIFATVFTIIFIILYNGLFIEIYSLIDIVIGKDIVVWSKIGAIAASWIISPAMGGIIAVLLLMSIRHTILKKDEKDEAAKKWVPFYVGLMAWVFTTYLILKGLKNLITNVELLTPEIAIFLGYIVGFIVYVLVGFHLRRKKSLFKNSKKAINKLFNFPLIFAVALLSFAHGANDVANAIGPIAAINDIVKNGAIGGQASISTWIMVLGAAGLSIGLMTFGGRLIKTVGKKITKLNQTKAFAVALSAAITVLIASALGLPVSSTHIALGGVFGVGLLTQHIKRMNGKDKEYIKKEMIRNIALAWIITLPVSGAIASIAYFGIMKVL